MVRRGQVLDGNADGFTALSITTVSNLVTDGCRDHTALDPPVGPTVDDLAIALSQLAPFEVTAPPTDVTLLGYQGKHLELTVPDLTVTGGGGEEHAQFTDCVDGELHSWISPLNDNGAASFSGVQTGPARPRSSGSSTWRAHASCSWSSTPRCRRPRTSPSGTPSSTRSAL